MRDHRRSVHQGEASGSQTGRETLDVQTQPNVLLVEDDAEFAEDMRAILTDIATIRHVGGTATAIAEIIREKPDLIMLDLDLEPFLANSGGLEGVAFLQVVREQIDGELPVVIVSGRMSEELKGTLQRLGAVACFTKPPDLRTLREIVQSASRHQVNREACDGGADSADNSLPRRGRAV